MKHAFTQFIQFLRSIKTFVFGICYRGRALSTRPGLGNFCTRSAILLSVLAVFGLSFGVAHADNPVTAAVGSFFSFSLDTISLLATYPLEMLSAAMATLLSIAGTLLDATIKLSLDTHWYTDSPVKEIITLGWGIIRDFFNLTFIFILLYNGIRIILDLDQSSKAKTIATDVLIAALLINFSLFFTQLVMDGSNMIAVGLYNSIQTVVTHAEAGSISEAINVTFANQALYNMGVNSLAGFDRFINVILRIVFSGLSIYVFISVSFLFIGRFVAFFLLMITSPIWIAGALIEKLKPYQGEFQKTLFDQAMLAPVFLFFLYIILQVITSDIFVTLSASGSDIPGGGSNKTGQVLVFAILAALLLVAKSQAKDLAGKIGATVNSYIGTAAGFAAGGVGMIGRKFATSAIGQKAIGAAAGATNNAVGAAATRVNSLTGRIPLVGGALSIDAAKVKARASKVTSYIAEGARTGSYDARRVTLPGATEALKNLGIDTKWASAGGLLKEMGVDAGKPKSSKEIKEEKKKYDAEVKLDNDIESLTSAINEYDAAIASGDTAAQQVAEAKIGSTLKGMSEADISKLDTGDKMLSHPAMLANLKSGDFEAISKNKDIPKNVVADMKKNRLIQITAAQKALKAAEAIDPLTGRTVGSEKEKFEAQDKMEGLLRNMTSAEITDTDPESTKVYLDESMMRYYNAGQVKALREKGHMSGAEQIALDTAIGDSATRYTYTPATATTPAIPHASAASPHKAFASEEKAKQDRSRGKAAQGKIRAAGAALSASDIQTIPDEVIIHIDPASLIDPLVSRLLSASQLDAIHEARILDTAQKRAIFSEVIARGTPSAHAYLLGPANPLWI